MKVAVCDDEDTFREKLCEYLQPYLKKYPEILVSSFSCGHDILKAYEQGDSFDILLLDIQMEDLDGVEVAKRIRQKDKNIILIFITSYLSFISDTFRVGAFQFLVKPVNQSDFCRDFERAIEQYKIIHFKYVIKWLGETAALEISEIFYIEAYSRHLFIYTENDRFECIGKLSEEVKRLRSYHFVRCHQGYLVNMEYIKLIDKASILLKNSRQIPMSKYFAVQVKEAFNDYLLGCCI